ncbi:glycoside hydrolase family 30 protein [Viscerimonas tarda]
MKNSIVVLLGIVCLCISCSNETKEIKWLSTTADSLFIEKTDIRMSSAADTDKKADVAVLLDTPLQSIDGFGGCFNELGWTTLSALNESDRRIIISDLFGRDGMNFSYCRLPVGANDFARDWYSFDETDKDFGMEHFSIDNDKETIIPFIKEALAVNPGLRLWASPWSPPTWMKYNKNYACRPNADVNELKGDPSQDLEGTNMFIQDSLYFKAYALYFRKFIEAYRAEGINIEMVAPQNEFNSCQIFPSCTWTAAGLNTFVGEYLGPQMKDLGVRVMFGTMERGDQLLVDTIMEGRSGEYISEIGFQWGGKKAIEGIHKTYPDMKLMQSESECGDGQNSWEYCFYIWNLMKHYFNNGISSYMYWNISLDIDPAKSRWKWPQNSLISVDQEAKTYKYNPEYYLIRHFSKFVKPGAVFLALDGEYKNALAFRNQDGSVVVIFANEEAAAKELTIRVGEQSVTVNAQANSINTLIL